MTFSADEDFSHQLDAEDPLRQFREQFHLPLTTNGQPLIYFAGNSLGLMPKRARAIVEHELDQWAAQAVGAHHSPDAPWYSYHELVREQLASLVGAGPDEVVCMNSLTVNLHLMLATFYRPTRSRFKILMEEPAFPSDTYAIKSQIAHHGFDPGTALVLVRPRERESTLRPEDFELAIEQHGEQLAAVLFGAINFLTGQLFDLRAITAAAQRHGIVAGFDLAHAVGNVPLSLHEWNVDFAVWCSYKYLNAGPGAVAGAFVHERHATNTALPRLAGWFGNDPNTRFQLHLQPEFIPVASADAWQVSNPPILSMAPLRASLELFQEAGAMESLRAKSLKLTSYLRFLLTDNSTGGLEVITPAEETAHGSQLSILYEEKGKGAFQRLEEAGVRCDFREPNVIRAAPAPLYNTFHEVWRFAQLLAAP
ncbi:MAG: kynureninase [Verrucomicrobia bacterium]|nr:kynureninase [Verrucomicrobiota bacterium]